MLRQTAILMAVTYRVCQPNGSISLPGARREKGNKPMFRLGIVSTVILSDPVQPLQPMVENPM
jgi:hypothetical protein